MGNGRGGYKKVCSDCELYDFKKPVLTMSGCRSVYAPHYDNTFNFTGEKRNKRKALTC